MAYDLTEWRLELHLPEHAPSLRSLPTSFWKSLLNQIGIQIIQESLSDFYRSFILSHSSLLVGDHHLILLTCGNRPLEPFLQSCEEHFGKGHHSYEWRFGEEKSEKKYEELQFNPTSSFVSKSSWFEGHWKIDPNTPLFERYAIGLKLSPNLFHPKLLTQLKKELFSQYSFIEHVFDPPGYSCNGVFKRDYVLFHLSIDEDIFLSVEWSDTLNLNPLIPLINHLAPIGGQVLLVSKRNFSLQKPNSYTCKNYDSKTFKNYCLKTWELERHLNQMASSA